MDMTGVTRLAALGAALVVLSACGVTRQAVVDPAGATRSGVGTTSAESAVSSTPPLAGGGAPAAAGDMIPDGRYVRVATAADAEAANLAAGQAQEFLGSDGELPLALEFEGLRMEHLVTNDAGVEEVGDLGTLDYPEDGRVVFTSESTGCPGCVATLEWSLEGDELTIEPSGLPPVEAFILAGTYTRGQG